MANDRVDKGWTKKGLDSYSTEAILGTLAHYGVATDESGFRALAEGQFPLQIARSWADSRRVTVPRSDEVAGGAGDLHRRHTGGR